MKSLIVIGETIAGVLVWLSLIIALPLGLIITARQFPRYLRTSTM